MGFALFVHFKDLLVIVLSLLHRLSHKSDLWRILRLYKSFCRGFLRVREFDQLISEKENSQGVPSWMHIGYKNSEGKQRKQLLSMIGGKYYPMT